MNWFAIGAGVAILIVGVNAAMGRTPRISKPLGVSLALVGLLFTVLGIGADRII